MIPRAVKWIFTLFMALFIPMNWHNYGLENFLWISDITLFLAFLATLFESRFCASLAAVGGIVFESLWVLAFFGALLFHMEWELTQYMFNSSIPLWVRLVSLFHIVLPPLLLWLLFRLGYVRKAWPIQTFVIWLVLILSWFLTEPSHNINFVFGYKKMDWEPLPYLLVEAIGMALILSLTHFLITHIRKIKSS